MSYCGAGEQDLLCINERQVMVRSKNMYDQEPPNTSLEGVRSDLEKRYVAQTIIVSNFYKLVVRRKFGLYSNPYLSDSWTTNCTYLSDP